MIRVLLVLALAAAAHGAPARARVETVVERTACWVGERVAVRLRLVLDERLVEEQLVQMFQRPFDLPVAVKAPWLAQPAPADGPTLVLNGKPATVRRGAPRASDGRRSLSFEIEGAVVPDAPGPLALAAPRLTYVFASSFRDDLVHGRTAVDQRRVSVEGARVVLDVRALPEKGRPGDFAGAIGRFTVRAEAAPRAVDAGDPVRVVVTLEGEGNWGAFALPAIAPDGFHRHALLAKSRPNRRVVVAELAPLHGGVERVPPIPFSYFDPERGAYATVETGPIPLDVRGDPPPAEPVEPEPKRSWLWLAAGSIAVLILLAAWTVRRRRTRTAEPSAADRFRERLQQPDTDVEAAFTEYVAAYLDVPAAAVVGPDLRARLESALVAPDLAGRTAMLLERLVGARYGGAAADGDARAEAAALVAELEATASRS